MGIQRRENLCVVGPSGTGKSHWCEALGQAAVEAAMAVARFSIEDLGALVRRHRADDSIAKPLTRVIRSDLIIVDLCRARDYAEVSRSDRLFRVKAGMSVSA
ncbi:MULTISPECIES: ATP-binding protein [unclassified Streptomyces]|uniref:ATP-binding protein n=1 Tax=unclassified Streptomyces TaxID=2593676 RepID=UPI002B1CD702|nr:MULTISPECIES: ATP-binding protein [unclassified Streptomyces]